jgi:hypothetical protein
MIDASPTYWDHATPEQMQDVDFQDSSLQSEPLHFTGDILAEGDKQRSSVLGRVHHIDLLDIQLEW